MRFKTPSQWEKRNFAGNVESKKTKRDAVDIQGRNSTKIKNEKRKRNRWEWRGVNKTSQAAFFYISD